AAELALATLELDALALRDLLDQGLRHAERADDVLVDEAQPAARDRAHRELLLTRQPQLPNEEDVERRAERPRDLRRDRDAAPRARGAGGARAPPRAPEAGGRRPRGPAGGRWRRRGRGRARAGAGGGRARRAGPRGGGAGRRRRAGSPRVSAHGPRPRPARV